MKKYVYNFENDYDFNDFIEIVNSAKKSEKIRFAITDMLQITISALVRVHENFAEYCCDNFDENAFSIELA